MNAPMPPLDAMLVARAPLSHFGPSATNRTHTDAHIKTLGDSIRVDKVIQPITARPWPNEDRPGIKARPNPEGYLYEIVIGEGRWRGSHVAGEADIPFFWRDLTDIEAVKLQMIENIKRKDLTVIQEAEKFRRLMTEFGYSADKVAEEIDLSRAYVYGRLKLLNLGKEGREAVISGKLDPSVALLVARVPASMQKKALISVLEGYGGEPVSYRTAKNTLASSFTIHLKQATFSPDDADLVAEVGSCTTCPKRAGNDPAMVEDNIDADVCTDTDCFDNKKQARRLQIISAAEAKGIKVFAGAAVNEITTNGNPFTLDERYVRIDDEVKGDADRRTYREILGDAAPVTAIAEMGLGIRDKKLVELAEPTALAKALKKAGFKAETHGANDQDQKLEPYEVKRAAEKAARDKENEWRKQLREQALAKVQDVFAIDTVAIDKGVALAVVAWLHHSAHYSDELPEATLERFGITVPAEFDLKPELARIQAIITQWPPGKALAFLLDELTAQDAPIDWGFDPATDRPDATLAVARFVGLDDSAMRSPHDPAEPEGSSTPTGAAQAHEVGADEPAAPAKTEAKKPAPKKAKAKATPAPAAPGNEPPSAVKTTAAQPAWPFPTGARA